MLLHIVYSLSAGTDFRRQILTSSDGPRTESVNRVVQQIFMLRRQITKEQFACVFCQGHAVIYHLISNII